MIKAQINITTNNNCGILILDSTKYQSENIEGNDFKKSELISVIALENINDDIIINQIIDNAGNVFNFFPKKDGYYKITMVLIPTKEYFFTHIIDESVINYYSDELKVYKYIENSSVEVPLEEIIRVNNTNTIKVELTITLVCNLKHCYFELCKNYIKNITKCAPENYQNFNKDLVWMTLNIIEYLIDFNLDEEAGKLLNLIQGCYGICKPKYSEENKNGCGCS